MPSKVALIQASAPFSGPWIRWHGYESEFEVVGDVVQWEGITSDGETMMMPFQPGCSPAPAFEISRHRFICTGVMPTSVFIHLD